jgi:hypothetical protein
VPKNNALFLSELFFWGGSEHGNDGNAWRPKRKNIAAHTGR